MPASSATTIYDCADCDGSAVFDLSGHGVDDFLSLRAVFLLTKGGHPPLRCFCFLQQDNTRVRTSSGTYSVPPERKCERGFAHQQERRGGVSRKRGFARERGLSCNFTAVCQLQFSSTLVVAAFSVHACAARRQRRAMTLRNAANQSHWGQTTASEHAFPSFRNVISSLLLLYLRRSRWLRTEF